MSSEHVEQFLLQLVDGPCPGRLVAVDATWPLPDELRHPPQGVYRKTAESQLGPQGADSHVIRGAMYHWQPA